MDAPRRRDPDLARAGDLWIGLGTGAIVLAAALVGIWSRHLELLASFWPANALLLGLLVRWPWLARPSTWLGATAGYLLADLLTGSTLSLTLGLSAANLVGVTAGWLFLRRRTPVGEPTLAGLGRILVGCLVAATAATVAGAPAGMALLDLSASEAIQAWFTAELAAYVAIVPIVVTIPWQWRDALPDSLTEWAPLAALPVALALGAAVGGPLTVTAFLPVLAWSALQGSVFRTGMLVLLTTAWNLVALGSGMLAADGDTLAANEQVAWQVGLALVGVGPLAVAASIGATRRGLARAQTLARTDFLTGLLNRGGFLESAERALDAARETGATLTFVMLDLDDFKTINDQFGHAMGDQLLASVGAAQPTPSRQTTSWPASAARSSRS